jgi:ribosomal protein S18 acetylase RimI-like enzyme
MSFTVEHAKESDCDFLGNAVLQAERAHTGRGVWDEFFGSCESAVKYLSLACKSSDIAGNIYHYSRFFVVRDNETGEPLASACCYSSSECGFISTADIVGKGLVKDSIWTEAEAEAATNRLLFTGDCFPPDLSWDGSRWMIEGVYTDSRCRGKGLGEMVLRAALEAGRASGENNCWITCAVGNCSAHRLYERIGFTLLGAGSNEECIAKFFTPGFEVLNFVY